MREAFERTELLLGPDGMEKLEKARIAVFGIGGVGCCAVEALARSGVGALDLYDSDRFSLSNLNRQIFATRATVGRLKAEVAAERVRQIDPEADVRSFPIFYSADTADTVELARYDYVVDAIDTVSAKLTLIQNCVAAGVRVISCMGTGNKMDPSALRVTDIAKTTVCPLARIMRKELGKRGIKHLKVVCSTELAMPAASVTPSGELPPEGRRSIPGSNAFVPCAAGFLIASEVVRELTGVRGAGIGI